jgi:pimeloyl-ACP methyl ester carboxylesterase
MLEVIDKGSRSEAHPAPLLFVHEGYHAAWCWDVHFLNYFADKGFRAVAVSLRGMAKEVGLSLWLHARSRTTSMMYAWSQTRSIPNLCS